MPPKEKQTNSFQQLIDKLFTEAELNPVSVEEVLQLPSFYSKMKACEAYFNQPYAAIDQSMQDQVTLKRLQQLTGICMLNPLWKQLLAEAGIETAPTSFDAWQQLPVQDKASLSDFFSGSRPGMVVPLERGGFEIVASGGTSSGKPSETVYAIKELHTTYTIAGDFMGRYMLSNYLQEEGPKWMITTLADYQMWSSGTMVGGVLQNIPGVNYIGAGPVMKQVYQHMMQYPGPKAIMGISQGIAYLKELGTGLGEDARNSLKIGMYGSGVLSQRKRKELQELYPNIVFLSYFAATQAETIGLQLDHTYPFLATIPGLHFVEIVDEHGRWVEEGEEGELVITRLHATEAPVLRFRLGDRMIRRSSINRDDLKTQQIEFAGRSGDVLHICDSQYPVKMVLQAVAAHLKTADIIDIDTMAHDTQFVNLRHYKVLTLLIAVDEPYAVDAKLKSQYGLHGASYILVQALLQSLSIFNSGEANQAALEKTGYRFDIRFVVKNSPEISTTEVGKIPILKDVF